MKHLGQNNQWVRSHDGWIAGVCQGLGERFGVNSGFLRLMWVFSILCLGAGLFMYFILAFCLPLEGQEEEALKPRILGVCSRLSQRMDLDVGLVRALAIVIGFGSAGTAILAYIILHFLIPSEKQTL